MANLKKQIKITSGKRLLGHQSSVYGLIKINEEEIISTCAGGMVACWTPFKEANGRLIAKSKQGVFSVCYDIAKNTLVFGQNNNGIRAVSFHKTEHSINQSIQLPNCTIFDLLIIKQHYWVLTSLGTIFLIDRETFTIDKKIHVCQSNLRSITYVPTINSAFIGASDQHIYTVDTQNFEIRKKMKAHQKSVFTLTYNAKRGTIVSGSMDAYIKEWIIEGNNLLLEREIVAHMYTINDLQFSHNFDYFATCSMDKTIKIWDADQCKLLKVIDNDRYKGHSTSINKLIWLKDHAHLAACSDDNSISVWNINIE